MDTRRGLLANLAYAIAQAPSGLDAPAKMCHAVCNVLGADGGSLTLDNASSNRLTLCTTNDVAARLESAQEVLGQGPCMEAYVTGLPIQASSELAWLRWPEFADRVQSAGVALFYALPMHTGNRVLGVVSLHQLTASGLTSRLSDAAFLVDAIGAAVIADAQEILAQRDMDAWPTRRDVHQATGIVIAQLSVDEDDALAILRAHAYADATDLATVARAVVNRQLVFDRESEGSSVKPNPKDKGTEGEDV